MADVELLLTRSSSPRRRGMVAPEGRNLPSGFQSDCGEDLDRSTPPPDYEMFLSDSELPSARIKKGLNRARHTSPNYSTFLKVSHYIIDLLM